jgi:hypothetical protein
MLSFAWRAKLCGEIGNNEGKLLNLDEEDEVIFSKFVALGCGESVTIGRGLEELVGLGRMADLYRMEAILSDVEEAVLNRLTMESCGLILTMTCGSGLVRLETESRNLALRKFDRFAECAGFLRVSEEALGSLLDDDGLISESEERVLKGVVRWMKGGPGGEIRGEDLLRKIRFPSMSGLFLVDEARSMLPENSAMKSLVLESSLLKHLSSNLWVEMELNCLDAAVLVPRRGTGVNWAKCTSRGDTRLKAGQLVYSVSAHRRGFVCGGLGNGSIKVWNRATLEEERTLTGHSGTVWALISVEGWLISGSFDHTIRVWDVATWCCERTLEGHADAVRCLAVSGGRLVSGSSDRTVKVWRIEGPSAWRCERTLAGHGSGVSCVETWGLKMASGSEDKTIRVWDVGAGTHEQTLKGHEGRVVGLVACGQRLISSSTDKAVRVWSMATWACTQTVQAYATGSAQCIMRLAVSGTTLVGGSCTHPYSRTARHEVRVWDLDSLERIFTLRQPAGQPVSSLASDGVEMWGAVGVDIVVWGHRPLNGGMDGGPDEDSDSSPEDGSDDDSGGEDSDGVVDDSDHYSEGVSDSYSGGDSDGDWDGASPHGLW